MTKDEALKLALEALKTLHDENMDYLTRNKLGGENNQCLVFAREAITAIKEALAQPEFIKHEVENADDWSEWVCPDPKGYLMKCCDCGLVHEAEFGVVRYKSETEREDCDMVDDPNLQAVFRMRRSEQWSPEDTAHRAGGLPMAQPEKEPVAWMCADESLINKGYARFSHVCIGDWKIPVYTTPPQRKPLTDEEILADETLRYYFGLNGGAGPVSKQGRRIVNAIEAAHGIKGEA